VSVVLSEKKIRQIRRAVIALLLLGVIEAIPILYLSLGRQYRSNILILGLTEEFHRNGIGKGCPLPKLLNYLNKRHGEPFKDPDGGPYILAYLGTNDIRVLGRKALIRFKISDHKQVESFSFAPDELPFWWTAPRS